MTPLEADAAEQRAKLAKAEIKVRTTQREIAEIEKAMGAIGKTMPSTASRPSGSRDGRSGACAANTEVRPVGAATA